MIVKWDYEKIEVKAHNSILMYYMGLINMLLIKLKRYAKTPSQIRPFPMADIKLNVNHVLMVLNDWSKVIKQYSVLENPFLGKSILEIGPGPDLGTGLGLLALGAKSYCSVDILPLAMTAPEKFYEALFDSLKDFPYVHRAREAYSEFIKNGFSNDLIFKQAQFPSLEGVPKAQYDIILSYSVWEHITEPEATLVNIMNLGKEGTSFINRVDFSTHGRIRKIDPLNILRYNDFLYKMLSVEESSNRLRSSDFWEISKKLGLKDTQIIPMRKVSLAYLQIIKNKLSAGFRMKEEKDLEILSCWWLATFPRDKNTVIL